MKRLATVVALMTVGCASGQLEVSPTLRAASTSPVTGTRVTCTKRDNGKEFTGVESVADGQRFGMDDVALVLSKPLLTDSEARPSTPEDVLAALEHLDTLLGTATNVGREVRAVTSVAGAIDSRGARLDRDVGGAVTAIGDARAFVGAVRDWITLPTTVSQQATLAFTAAKDGDGARVFGVCRSTNAVPFGQTFTPSDFQLNCQLAAEGDTKPYSLWLTAAGSGWVDYIFRGTLKRAGDPGAEDPGWNVLSQSGRVLGAGFVKGFELRRGERQDAAVAFLEDATWDVDTLASTATPRAWWNEQRDPSQTLLVQTALLLLTAHPLVGTCDAAILTDRATPASLKQD